MGDLAAANEVRISERSWRANGGKIMRRIHETMGEDSYRLRYHRFADMPSNLHSVVIAFNSAEDAVVFRLVTDREWHDR